MACGRATPVSLGGGGLNSSDDDPGLDTGYWDQYDKGDGENPSFIPNGIPDGDPIPDLTDEDASTPPSQVPPQVGSSTLSGLQRLLAYLRGQPSPTAQDTQMQKFLSTAASQIQANPQNKQAVGQGLFGMLVQKGCQKGTQLANQANQLKQTIAFREARMKKSARRAKNIGVGLCFMKTMGKLGPRLKSMLGNMNGQALKLLQQQAMK